MGGEDGVTNISPDATVNVKRLVCISTEAIRARCDRKPRQHFGVLAPVTIHSHLAFFKV